ncbi:MAG: hypothetical protein L0216_07540 [Planctomycetales bacterium]|nr:hypothetical protein [Planctomycetales bacterium]
MRTKALVLLWAAGTALAPHASAEPQQKSKQDPTLTKPELAAFAMVEKEMLRLSAAAMAAKDAPAAERSLRLGLDVLPGSTKLKTELERIHKLAAAGKAFPPGPPTAAAREKLASIAAEARAACGKALAEAALLVKSDFPERFERTVGIVKTSFPTEEALAKLDPAYFPLYYTWFSKEGVARLDAGGELLDGKWLDADAVAEKDRLHSEWANPWVISDEAHEVSTTLPLRTAKQFLHYIGHFRRYVLSRFGPFMDLRHPGGKLPVSLALSREELGERLRKLGTGLGASALSGCATYFCGPDNREPLYVCFDLLIGEADVRVPAFDYLRVHVTRELAYQILYEYSKHSGNKTRQVEAQFWAVHAIGRYLSFHAFDGLAWRLTRPQQLPLPPGLGALESPFAWCKAHRADLPPLKDYVALPRNQLELAVSIPVKIAPVFGWFLIEGEGGKYATKFFALAQEVFRIQDTPKLFDQCFAGVDAAGIQKEWERFVESYTLD